MGYRYYWPPNDIYFGAGVKGLIDYLAVETNERNYFFVNLNAYSLISSFHFFSHANELRKKIVIISSPRLSPLAEFWLAENDNIIAAFSCFDMPDNIVRQLIQHQPGEKIANINVRSTVKVNRKDIITMKYFLYESGMKELTERFINSPSTVYRWRKCISEKFGVKEPRHLLIPEKLT
ncbi:MULTISPECIES: Vi polysaccharide biosynthesis protein TviA [Pantoea]|uniref:Vi polysaccharide biosynthesis protein TviA n=1 Tax=Pantoea TaxID=53335 RepID=UPI0007C76E50|nr:MULTISPECIES: Vi polysaccharide biosynthesis protein TviA [Pantoea]MDJ0042437.1 Vi polysaccharide biosynthesis protein TviA [Pantoea allii]OAE09644.1 Vi polysaccharide biosynthesis protein TviA [Pantoea sp. OXWO6B1]